MVSAYRLDPGKISPWQLLLILIVVVIATADIFLPSVVAQQSGRDSWVAVIIATALGLVIASVVLALSLRFPKQNLIEICHTVLGKWLGWAVALSIVLFFIFFGIKTIGQSGLVIKTAFLTDTPLIVLNGLMVLIIAYAVYYGLETIARLCEILVPIGLLSVILVGVLVLPVVDFGRFLPVLDEGMGIVLTGSVRLSSWLAEVFVIMMLMPHLNQPRQAVKIVALAVGSLGVFMMVGVMAIGMFGAELVAIGTFPALHMIRVIAIVEFLDHLDSIIITIWMAGVFLKGSIILYFCCIGLAQLCGAKSYRPLIIPTGIIIAIGASQWFHDVSYMKDYLASAWPAQSLTIEFLIPLLLLTVAAARGLREDTHQNNPGIGQNDSKTPSDKPA